MILDTCGVVTMRRAEEEADDPREWRAFKGSILNRVKQEEGEGMAWVVLGRWKHTQVHLPHKGKKAKTKPKKKKKKKEKKKRRRRRRRRNKREERCVCVCVLGGGWNDRKERR